MPRYIEGDFLPPKGRFAICVARFNAFITEELLALLDRGELYGVEIVDLLAEHNGLEASAGTIYPLLSRLKKAGVVPANALKAKVVLSGEIKTAVTVKGVGVTKGARAAIEAAGGKVEAA